MATIEWIYREFSSFVIVYGLMLAAMLLARLIISRRKFDMYTLTAPDGRQAEIRLSTSLTSDQRAAIVKQTLENLQRGACGSAVKGTVKRGS